MVIFPAIINEENNLICWHYNHCINHLVKGIKLLNYVYYSKDRSLPVAFELLMLRTAQSECGLQQLDIFVSH